MPYVVTEGCIRCKYTECVEVCPVDCFHEGESMLVIDPRGCIDCGVCEAECPAEAIVPGETSEAEPWADLNARYARLWPRLTVRRPPPVDAAQFETIREKFARYFSPSPGLGD